MRCRTERYSKGRNLKDEKEPAEVQAKDTAYAKNWGGNRLTVSQEQEAGCMAGM